MSLSVVSRRCSATTRAGEPCKAYAIRDSQLCAAHSRNVGAPKGNQNRKTHGVYVRAAKKMEGIGDVATDLMAKQEQLSAYIDGQLAEGLGSEDMVKLLGLLAQNASRLGRLLRDQRALSGESADGLLEAVGKLMDEINTQGELKVIL
ncbi:MAG TPA: hypothetical protein ENH62_01605 [Marinobacter sp.]|nr:hypothetical protein [Marinobacter sp.]